MSYFYINMHIENTFLGTRWKYNLLNSRLLINWRLNLNFEFWLCSVLLLLHLHIHISLGSNTEFRLHRVSITKYFIILSYHICFFIFINSSIFKLFLKFPNNKPKSFKVQSRATFNHNFGIFLVIKLWD